MFATSLVLTLGLGLILGIQHAFEPDHLAAVSTLGSCQRSLRRSSLLGVVWGLGHTTTLLLSGLIVLAFRLSIPQYLTISFEGLVGVMLLFLGISTLLRARKDRIHIHRHSHGEGEHVHLHSHRFSDDHYHGHERRSYAIGLVHGLAGSGTMILIVLSSVDSLIIAMLYILLFGLGSILGMLSISGLIGWAMVMFRGFVKTSLLLRLSAGSLSFLLGIIIIAEAGGILL